MTIDGVSVAQFLAASDETKIEQTLSKSPAAVKVFLEFIAENPSWEHDHSSLCDRVRLLYGASAAVDRASELGGSVLRGEPTAKDVRQAIDRGDAKELSQLLARASNPNLQFADGKTVLTYAVSRGQVELVRAALDAGAEPGRADDNGAQTPLIVAAGLGKAEVLQLLLDRGADPTTQDDSGTSPLIASAFRGHADCVKLLLAKGVKPDEATAVNGYTALHAAAYEGHTSIVVDLLENGADPLKLDDSGACPLFIAASRSKGMAYLKLAKGVDLASLTEQQQKDLIMHCAIGGLAGPLGKIIQVHPDVNFTNKEGQSPLMEAVANGSKSTAKVLLKHGAEVKGHTDSHGHDALINAALGMDASLFRLLVEAGADPAYRDAAGFTAMEYLQMLAPHEARELYETYPQSAVDSMLHFNLCSEAEAALIDQNTLLNEWVPQISMAIEEKRADGLRARLQAPIDHGVKAAADSLYSELKRTRYDLESLRTSSVDKYTELQQERMGASTTMTIGFEGAGEKEEAIRDWKAVDTLVRSWAEQKKPLDVDMFCHLNRMLNRKNRTGKFRDGGMTSGGSILRSYPPPEDVRPETALFFRWLDNSLQACDQGSENPIIVAARSYQWLVSIHPFNDGNGRTCRMVMDYVLQRYGLPPSCPDKTGAAMFAFVPDGLSSTDAVNQVVIGLDTSRKFFGN